MKIFIRDSGEGGGRRRAIVRNIAALVSRDDVELAVAEKEEDLKLFLYHQSDIDDNRTEYEYIEKTVLNDPEKLLILYSGTVRDSSVPLDPAQENIWQLTPENIINRLGDFIEWYLANGNFEPRVLLGIDPSYEAAINLLTKFLPLDIALQGADVERCREAASPLIGNQEQQEMAHLVNIVLKRGVRPNKNGTGADAARRPVALDQLIELTRTCAEMEKETANAAKWRLYKVFGFELDNSGKRKIDDQGRPILCNTGFHRTYERLRDDLLGIIE